MDVVGAVRTYLLADAGVTAATSGRVYGGELDHDEQAQQPRAAIVLRYAGGGLLGRGQLYGDRRLDIDCLGADPKEAAAVWDACRTALKALQRQKVSGVLLHWAALSSDGVSGHDPQTGWPVCVGTFQVLAADITAA